MEREREREMGWGEHNDNGAHSFAMFDFFYGNLAEHWMKFPMDNSYFAKGFRSKTIK